MNDLVPKDNGGEILLYQSEDGKSRIEVRLVGETLWLTQNQMAELFGVDKSGISRHLKNIYETGELRQESVVAKFATTAADGSNRLSPQPPPSGLSPLSYAITPGARDGVTSNCQAFLDGSIRKATAKSAGSRQKRELVRNTYKLVHPGRGVCFDEPAAVSRCPSRRKPFDSCAVPSDNTRHGGLGHTAVRDCHSICVSKSFVGVTLKPRKPGRKGNENARWGYANLWSKNDLKWSDQISSRYNWRHHVRRHSRV